MGNILGYALQTQKNHKAAFHYDHLDHLICEESSAFSRDYRYDSHHNRINKDGRRYQLDSLHQLTVSHNASYEYDPNGNRIVKHTIYGPILYRYDALDRLIEIRHKDIAIQYAYDALHRRMSKTIYTEDSPDPYLHHEFLYDGENEIGHFENDHLKQLRILGQGLGAEIGAAVALEIPEEIYFPVHDIFGNITSLLSLDGRIIESYEFSTFGEEHLFDSSGNRVDEVLNPWRYQSKRTDEESGLIFFGRRYYDRDIGSWISPDPKGYDEGPSLYQFLLCNPLIHVDLYGLENIFRNLVSDANYILKYTAQGMWNEPMRSNPNIAFGPVGNALVHHFSNACKNAYNHNYEPFPRARSSYEWIGDKEHPHAATMYISGILTPKSSCHEVAKIISDNLGGHKVLAIHNASHGLIPDIIDAKLEGLGFQTNVVKMTKQQLLDQVKLDKTVDLFAHSEGFAIATAAVRSIKEAEFREKIHIYGFGGADYFNPNKCASATNKVSTGDLIPFIVSPFRYNYIANESRKGNAQQSMDFLPKSSSNPLKEHGILSNTYLDELKLRCSRIQSRYEN
ncbi:MAG: hypothetical protein Tsb0015_08470 [Simkaniaceae bacterium]